MDEWAWLALERACGVDDSEDAISSLSPYLSNAPMTGSPPMLTLVNHLAGKKPCFSKKVPTAQTMQSKVERKM